MIRPFSTAATNSKSRVWY